MENSGLMNWTNHTRESGNRTIYPGNRSDINLPDLFASPLNTSDGKVLLK